MRSPRRPARFLVAAVAAGALAAATPTAFGTPTAPAASASVVASAENETRPSTYELPGRDVFPEGIALLSGEFYVTSTADGTVFRGDVDRERADVFLPGGRDGRTTAVGIKATATRLIIAGGGTGQVWVYDHTSGDLVARFSNGLGGQDGRTFVNGRDVAPNGDVLVTDSTRPVPDRIPAAAVAKGKPGTVQRLKVSRGFRGTPFEYREGFNANGIVATPDGRYVLVVQSNTGSLFRIRLSDRAVTRVRLDEPLTAGDGLALTNDRTLYAVRNSAERVVEVKLSPAYRRGRTVSSTTDESFRFPTTAAIGGDRLLLVNSQFDQRGGDPVEPFTVSAIPLP